jgi:hypothetical protein
MASQWLYVSRGSYRLKRGDVLCLRGEKPENVFSGLSDDGYVVTNAAGTPLRHIWADYEEDDDMPRLYTKKKVAGTPTRLALHKVFSKPLPIP